MPSKVHRYQLDLGGEATPVVEVTGTPDGPTLTVLTGVHGCEYAPMAAVRQWWPTLRDRDLHGTVRAVPVLNMPAFRARSAFVVPEDGKNLNRCFPGNPEGSVTERLAHGAFTRLIEDSDALVDAHAGDLPEALEPFALYDAGPSESRALELALAYGLGYVIRQEPGPERAVAGSTSAAAAEIGVPAIIAEAGGRGLIESAAVSTHIRGLNGVLAALGMTNEPAERRMADPVRLTRFLWLYCAQAGWWQPTVKPGEAVSRGHVLGTVTSIDGADVLETVTAPASGVPIFITDSPSVVADGLLLGLGAP